MLLKKVIYKDIIPLNYMQSPDIKLKILKDKYDLAEISYMTKVSLTKLKTNYRQGLFILLNAIKAFNTITKHQNEDLRSIYCKYDIEAEWKKSSKFLQYIPYIGIEEFAILYNYEPEVLNNLKFKCRGDRTK